MTAIGTILAGIATGMALYHWARYRRLARELHESNLALRREIETLEKTKLFIQAANLGAEVRQTRAYEDARAAAIDNMVVTIQPKTPLH